MAFKIVAVFFLVGMNGFFVAAEFALVKIRVTQLQPLVDEGQRRAKIAHYIVDNLDAFLSACQLGITLASLALGWIGEPIFETLLEPVYHWLEIESETAKSTISFGFGFSVITILHIVVGEVAPKSLAIQKPLPTSLWVAYPMMWFYKISYPFVAVLNWASQQLLRIVGIGTATESQEHHSEEELRLLVASNREQAKRSRLGREIVMNALDLGNRIAREVMQPRINIVALDTDTDIDDCIRIANKSNFSRFLLCEDDDLDHTIGVVHIKDIYGRQHRAKRAADLLSASHKIIYIPETCRLEKLLQLFLQRKLHLAIVVDEFGGTVGMVTIEDVLEELVGEIQDEFDQETPQLKQLDDGTWEASGMLPVHELEDLVGESALEEGISTISGLLTQRLGGFPKEGDKLEVGEFEIEVTETAGPKVEKVKFSRKK
ncbi:MAG: hemolysin family protein [Verrucomicrobiota bacterium]|nr:hemolysin family protein [Verrucomicrobiota bacterium]